MYMSSFQGVLVRGVPQLYGYACVFYLYSATVSKEMEQNLKLLLSESNKQQQDLESVSEDLGSLKFGFALLQEDNAHQARLLQQLMDVNTKLLQQLKKQDSKLDDISEDLQDKAETLEDIEGLVHPCGGSGWRELIILDMRDPDQDCPNRLNPLTNLPIRACGRTARPNCDNLRLNVEEPFSKVCGRVVAYQLGNGLAFSSQLTSITQPYVHGLVVGRRRDGFPVEHIWTFAVGSTNDDPSLPTACPCASDGTNLNLAPPFVRNDYFCESGNNDAAESSGSTTFFSDALWDGKNCFGDSECCAFSHPPYFVKDLGIHAAGTFGVNVCAPSGSNIAIEVVEFYVQ